LHGNDNRGYEILIMKNVGARRAVPLQMMWTVSPNSVLGKLRICRGFEQLSLDFRLHGNDNRGYEILIMKNVGHGAPCPYKWCERYPRTPFWVNYAYAEVLFRFPWIPVWTGMTIGALILLRSLSSFEMTNI